MPSTSRRQRRAAAIAEHASPDEIAQAGPAVQQMAAGMDKSQLHDFAATPEKKLPEKVHHKKHRGDHRSGGRQKKERGDYSK